MSLNTVKFILGRGFMKVTALFSSSVILALLSACACETPVQPEIAMAKHGNNAAVVESKKPCYETVDLTTNKCSETITATFDHKGVLWIAWVRNEHIYVQSSNDKGISFSLPVIVNPIAEKVEAKGEYRPKIKLDRQGNIFLTWTLKLEPRYTGYIRFSRSSDGGKHFTSPMTVNNDSAMISHRFDTLAIGKQGEIFIAWLDARDFEAAKKAGQPYEGTSLYYAWSNDGGQHFYPNNRIATHTCQCCRLDSAIAPDNTPVIFWRHIFEGGIRDHALVKFYDWKTPGDTFRVGQDNWKIEACPHHGPALSISDNGIFHSVWFSNSETSQGLFYAHSKDQGRHFSKPKPFGEAGAGHPHVLAFGAHVNIVWQEYDGQHNLIKLMQSVDNGNTWLPSVTIFKTTEQGDQPFLINDGTMLYLSWKGPQQNYQLKPLGLLN